MAGLDLLPSNLVLVIALILVIVGIVTAVFWFFKRSENLSDEDRLNVERSKVAFLAAGAVALFVLVAHKKEKHLHYHVRSPATLL